MTPLPSLASHKPGRSSLRTECGEGNQQGRESVGLTGCVGQTLLLLALVEAHHAAIGARFGGALVLRKMLKLYGKTLIFAAKSPLFDGTGIP